MQMPQYLLCITSENKDYRFKRSNHRRSTKPSKFPQLTNVLMDHPV